MSPSAPPVRSPQHRGSQPGEPPWEIALLFPAQGSWSEEDYLSLDTNRLVEFSDGCVEVLPMPTVLHQLIVQFLYRLLDDFVRAEATGLVLIAPLPVHLWTGKYREPDVVYLRSGRVTDPRSQPEGADLVMEVVSEGEENRERDLVTKRLEYARARISEYWIVDPQERSITVLRLDGAAYRESGKFGPGTQAVSELLAGFSVAVNAVFAAGENVK
jgi:Uma2 family endonuclease